MPYLRYTISVKYRENVIFNTNPLYQLKHELVGKNVVIINNGIDYTLFFNKYSILSSE